MDLVGVGLVAGRADLPVRGGDLTQVGVLGLAAHRAPEASDRSYLRCLSEACSVRGSETASFFRVFGDS